jgi:hypothetical protein
LFVEGCSTVAAFQFSAPGSGPVWTAPLPLPELPQTLLPFR